MFFDELFNRFIVAINGAPIVNSMYSLRDVLNYELIKQNKNVSAIVGSFQTLIENLIIHGF